MSTDQESFEKWYETHGDLGYQSASIAWIAAIAHIKRNFTICEKEPRRYIQELSSTPLYREVK